MYFNGECEFGESEPFANALNLLSDVMSSAGECIVVTIASTMNPDKLSPLKY